MDEREIIFTSSYVPMKHATMKQRLCLVKLLLDQKSYFFIEAIYFNFYSKKKKTIFNFWIKLKWVFFLWKVIFLVVKKSLFVKKAKTNAHKINFKFPFFLTLKGEKKNPLSSHMLWSWILLQHIWIFFY